MRMINFFKKSERTPEEIELNLELKKLKRKDRVKAKYLYDLYNSGKYLRVDKDVDNKSLISQ